MKDHHGTQHQLHQLEPRFPPKTLGYIIAKNYNKHDDTTGIKNKANHCVDKI